MAEWRIGSGSAQRGVVEVKVKKLIEKLQEFPQNATADVLWDGNRLGGIYAVSTMDEELREHWAKQGFKIKPNQVILGAGN